LAGDIIPEVGNILKAVGTGLEMKNEAEINDKLRKVS